MQKPFEKLQVLRMSGLDWVLLVATGVLLLLGGSSLAQQLTKKSFSSPDEACRTLFAAVKNGNEREVIRVLGGRDEIVSSGDPDGDKQDREQFIQKYQQMHRLVEEPDGTTVLYVGAENWPFPVPLISKEGKWYFDDDAGAQEIVFRRVGENESATIELCRQIAPTYTTQMIKADALQTNGPESGAAQHGYYFRKLEDRTEAAVSPIAVAYPAEYRSSGVMTFVVTRDGGVYQKDLGPQTATAVSTMTTWKPDRSWSSID